MKVLAMHLGQRIQVKRFTKNTDFDCLLKEPHLFEYEPKKWFALFRYGVVVMWNFSQEDQKSLMKRLKPYVEMALDIPMFEEMNPDEVKRFGNLSPQKVRLGSTVLSRSVVMDYFEQKVDEILNLYMEVSRSLMTTGKAGMKTKTLLKQVGSVMSIRNAAVSQLSVMDKPDSTWEDSELDVLYTELEAEYELWDRFEVLNQKLEAIYKDSEFIIDALERRSMFIMELMIVLLFLYEVLKPIADKLFFS